METNTERGKRERKFNKEPTWEFCYEEPAQRQLYLTSLQPREAIRLNVRSIAFDVPELHDKVRLDALRIPLKEDDVVKLGRRR